jgi:hypothetical protein
VTTAANSRVENRDFQEGVIEGVGDVALASASL